ncbi:MAG: serine/threonine-protein kinase [Anaerolineae bacterium]|nr:serine/threonine-protein kinase [Anaerolineae bacterium]
MPETTQFSGTENTNHIEGTLKANTMLMERYRIMGIAGGGGMGTVYQARDTRFPDAKRMVAIKEMVIPNTNEQVRQSALKNFKRESDILASLSHPAIPKIFDISDENDRAYLIMEFINGSDLEMILNKTRELPIEKILEWAIDLCDVLEYLHSHKPDPIIFRDLKPANIMIDSLGKVRLIDFGIAKLFTTDHRKHTMIGTEGYSAPEQYKGDVNPLSDIYGLGATLHHVLTRRDPRLEPPFSFNERPIREINPKVPPSFIAVVEKSLELKPENRFQSCGEMKAALEAVRSRPSMSAPSVSNAAGGGQNTMLIGQNTPAPAPQSTSFFDDMGGQAPSGLLEPRWKFKTEDEIRGGPSAYKGLVFVGSYDTNMWAVNLEDGKQVWKHHTEGGIAATPVVDSSSGLVFFGSEDQVFRAVDHRSGRINWTFPTKGRIRSSATLAHDHVFFGSDDGKVYALFGANGRLLWEYDLGAPVRVRPFVTNEVVIAASDEGDIVAIELSGKRKWATRAKRSINSSPFVDMKQNICYYGSFDGFLYASDASSGYSIWRFRTNAPIVSSPLVQDNTVYFGSVDGTFFALNAENAKERWRYTLEKPIVGSPVLRENNVYFGGTDGFFYCLDAKSGRELWKFETKGQITSAPFIIDNMILVASMDKTLYALPLFS